MTNELIFEALSDIDDVYVLEAKALFDGKPKIKMWKKIAVTAACFALVFAAALPFLSDILSPVLDTRHNDNHPDLSIFNDDSNMSIEGSPDNIIAVNPAVNNPPSYESFSHELYKNLTESEKKAFEETFTNETGYILNEFASALSKAYPTSTEEICFENSDTYVFTSELSDENCEYANIRIAAKKRFDGSRFCTSSDNFYPQALSEPIIMSEISGVPVQVFHIDEKNTVYIAIFENDKVNFQVEAFTGDVSKLELLISAILTIPESE